SDPGKRPPHRRGVVADVLRQVLVHPDLNLVDRLQEAPGRSRHDQADQRGEYEQRAVLPAADHRRRVEGERGGVHEARRPEMPLRRSAAASRMTITAATVRALRSSQARTVARIRSARSRMTTSKTSETISGSSETTEKNTHWTT